MIGYSISLSVPHWAILLVLVIGLAIFILVKRSH
jgi:hypothetical protein